MSLGIKSSAFLGVFTMGSWIHDGFAVNILPSTFWGEKNLREKKQGGHHPGNTLYTDGRRNIATKWMRPGPGIWKSGTSEIQKITNIKITEIKIRSAQNVGKVWISRKKQLPAPFGAI